MYEKEFIKELIPINQPVNKQYAKILEIYSNCIKFISCANNNNPDTLVFKGNWYFVSYKAIDFISTGTWLVSDIGESLTTHASKQEDNFLELLSIGKSLFRTECNLYQPYPCYTRTRKRSQHQEATTGFFIRCTTNIINITKNQQTTLYVSSTKHANQFYQAYLSTSSE